jgi:mRNA interferase MazF
VVGAGEVKYQWHIFLASLDPIKGSEQAGRRPVLVFSREEINQFLPVVNVIPLTSRKSPERILYPNEVLLPAGTGGLARSHGIGSCDHAIRQIASLTARTAVACAVLLFALPRGTHRNTRSCEH